jgi:response regulator RpfG family c-di-GMP phosphodiesterase
MRLDQDQILASTPLASGRGDVDGLSDLALHPSVERAVSVVRSFLGMEIAYLTQFIDGQQHFQLLRGDGDSFGVHEGIDIPIEATYCQRILSGRLPNLIPDVRRDERAAAVEAGAAAGIGAYASVPITLSDGRLYGTLCAASHHAQPSLEYRDLQFLRVFARIIADQIENEQRQRQVRTLSLRAGTTAVLLRALALRDGYTAADATAVAELAIRVADRLALDEAAIQQLEELAILHDIGKIAVPEAILNRPGSLEPDELDTMRAHSLTGAEMVLSSDRLTDLAPLLRSIHEHWDGSGYPDGLAGEEIPRASRIVLVCNAYHAMISPRPYRAALTDAQAREQITAGIGKQFCPISAATLLAELDS